jgi:hypothetical protein
MRLTNTERKIVEELKMRAASLEVMNALVVAAQQGKLMTPALIAYETHPSDYRLAPIPVAPQPYDENSLAILRSGIEESRKVGQFAASSIALIEHLWAVFEPEKVEAARAKIAEGDERVSRMSGAREILRLTFVGRMDHLQILCRVRRDGVTVTLDPWQTIDANTYVTGELIPNSAFIQQFSNMIPRPT